MAKKVLVLGNLGMLGAELMRAFSADSEYAVTGWDRDDLDLTDFEQLRTKLSEFAPDIVVNAAAYNAVDACEGDADEFKKALTLNRDLPSTPAEASRTDGFIPVHYSTDYVFDGTLEPPEALRCAGGCCGGNCHGSEDGYDEAAMPNPISRYGESKLAGENAVRQRTEKYYLIRLSKPFGRPGSSPAAKRSFFDVMLEAGRTKEKVSVVDSETSCFTYAPDLAEATKQLIEAGAAFGIYHIVNSGAVTWFEAVEELYRLAGIETPIEPVTPDAFPRPAKRPKFSVLKNTKLPPLRPYEEALREHLHSLAA